VSNESGRARGLDALCLWGREEATHLGGALREPCPVSGQELGSGRRSLGLDPMEGLQVGDRELEDVCLFQFGVSRRVLSHRLQQNPFELIEAIVDSSTASLLHYRLVALKQKERHEMKGLSGGALLGDSNYKGKKDFGEKKETVVPLLGSSSSGKVSSAEGEESSPERETKDVRRPFSLPISKVHSNIYDFCYSTLRMKGRLKGLWKNTRELTHPKTTNNIPSPHS